MPRATIVYIAPFEHDYGTEFHLARDAAAIGCHVFQISEQHAADVIGDNGNPYVSEYDLWLYTKGRGLPDDDAATNFWSAQELRGAKTASFSLDLYHGLRRESEVGNNAFWTTGTVFTADGGSQDWFAHRGVNHHWLPPACVSDECIEVPERLGLMDHFGHEPRIVFVGSTMAYHGEHRWRYEMLGALDRRYGDKFVTLGPQSGYTVRGWDLNKLYQRDDIIVVGDSLALPGHRDYFSDRYFETVGRGGFLIGPRVPGIESFLTEGEHFVGYDQGDLGQLFDRIDFWLDNGDKAREIARAGQAHVRQFHTYKNRVADMLDVLGL